MRLKYSFKGANKLKLKKSSIILTLMMAFPTSAFAYSDTSISRDSENITHITS